MSSALDIRILSGTHLGSVVEGKGYFPVITGLGGERAMVVHRAGAGHIGLQGRLEATFTEDGGHTWSAPVTIADSERDDRNPALGVAPDGSIVVAYHWQGSYNEKGEWDPALTRADTRLVYSTDGGNTWADDALINYTPINGASPFGKIRIIDGHMHMMIYGGSTIGDVKKAINVRPATTPTCILRSSDNGRSWGDPTLVALGLNESDMIALPDGSWLFAARSEERDEQAIYTARSSDGGRSWALIGRVTERMEHPPDLTLLGNGWILLTFGHRHPPYGVQGLVSKDSGATWEPRRLIFDDALPGGDIGYPSTVRLDNGRLITVYYTAGTRDKQWEIYNALDAACRAVLYDENTLIDALS